MADLIRAEWEKPFNFRQMMEEAQSKQAQSRQPATEADRTITIQQLEALIVRTPTVVETHVLFVGDPDTIKNELEFTYYVMMQASKAPFSKQYDLSYYFRERFGQLPFIVTVRVADYELGVGSLRTQMYRNLSYHAIPAWYKEKQWPLTPITQ